MMAKLIGYFLGFTLALGGFAYIVLGLLWVARLYKRWPKACAWFTIAFAVLVGLVTIANATSTADAAIGLLGVVVVVIVMSWREKLFAKAAPA